MLPRGTPFGSRDAGMIIEISTSGGFGGLSAAGMRKRIDVEQQAPGIRQELCGLFEPADLKQLAARSRSETRADAMTYEIRLIDRRSRKTYTIREDQLPPDMLDLIDSF